MNDDHRELDDPECCRCGLPIAGFYFQDDNASPVHWDCLSEEEQDERGAEVPA